jgi:hypothetical protein
MEEKFAHKIERRIRTEADEHRVKKEWAKYIPSI